MYIFLIVFLFTNVILMSKMFVYLLELMISYALIPMINWINGIHKNIYKLEIRKVTINRIVDESDNESEDIVDSDDSKESENFVETPKSLPYIDEKLD